MDFVFFEIVLLMSWIFFLLGFYDRVFWLIGMTVGFTFAAFAMNDGTFTLDEVYNTNTATWIQYTVNVYPEIIWLVMPCIASFLVFIVTVLPATESYDKLF